jgi:hypothetical protein
MIDKSALDAEYKKNKPKIESKQMLKNKYGSKYIFVSLLFI